MRTKAGRRRPLPGGDARAPADSIPGPCGMDPRPKDTRRDEAGGCLAVKWMRSQPRGTDLRAEGQSRVRASCNSRVFQLRQAVGHRSHRRAKPLLHDAKNFYMVDAASTCADAITAASNAAPIAALSMRART